VHYRCSNGDPDFQYRLKFALKYPARKMTMRVQAFDRDLLSASDFIGEAAFDLI
jgi:hypothetical protein